MRAVAPGNRDRSTVLYVGGVVPDAGHFIDAAGGYSDVDTYGSVFRAGTRERCISIEH